MHCRRGHSACQDEQPEHGLSRSPGRDKPPFGTGFGRAVGSGVPFSLAVVARNYDDMMTGLQRCDVPWGDLGEREVLVRVGSASP